MGQRNELGTLYKPTSPGSILKEELRERKINQRTFSKTICMQETHLSEIINGKRRITPDIAEKLENALGIRAITWTNLQNGYDYDCKQKQSNSEAKIEANKSLLIREILNIKDNAALEKLSAYIKSIWTSESH